MTNNKYVLDWINEMADLVKPGNIVWIDGSKEQIEALRKEACETGEMIKCAEQLKLSGTPVLAVTRYAESTLAGQVDYILYTSAREALFRRGASSSRISQLNVVDILYTAYVNTDYEAFLGRFNKTYIDKRYKWEEKE